MNYSEKNTCICISESLCCSPEIYRTLSINHLLLFSHYVMPNSMRPHGLQHVRLLCLPLVHCFLWWWKISPVILFYRTLFEKKKKRFTFRNFFKIWFETLGHCPSNRPESNEAPDFCLWNNILHKPNQETRHREMHLPVVHISLINKARSHHQDVKT